MTLKSQFIEALYTPVYDTKSEEAWRIFRLVLNTFADIFLYIPLRVLSGMFTTVLIKLSKSYGDVLLWIANLITRLPIG